jgi:hypothetical protein
LEGVRLPTRGDGLLVVSFDRRERCVGHAFGEQARSGADESVAVDDVVVEEAEGLAWFHRFEPETDLAQLYSHRVDVDAVDAVRDDVAHCGLGLGDAGFVVSGADASEAMGDSASGGDEEVTGPDRWIADGQAEDGSFGVWARLCFVEECVQAGFEEAVDQRGRGVVSTGCLTFVAGQGVEREGPS